MDERRTRQNRGVRKRMSDVENNVETTVKRRKCITCVNILVTDYSDQCAECKEKELKE